jgi:hypothetical protein
VPDAERVIAGGSGTSLSAGCVSGLVLCLRSIDARFAKAKDMVGLLQALATKDVIKGLPEGTSNLLAYSGRGLGE